MQHHMRPCMSTLPSLLHPSEVSAEDIQAVVRCLPFPRGVRLAVESGGLRFAKSTPPLWRTWGRGRHKKPRPELQAVFTDSSGKVAAVAKLPPADKKDPLPPVFEVIGDCGWPVGLADAAPEATLLLVRGTEDAVAARELWAGAWEGLPLAVIAMLADGPLSADALEKLRGRGVILVDFGAADAGFVFGGWREQLLGVDVVALSTLTGLRRDAGKPLPNLNLSSALRVAVHAKNENGAKFDLHSIKALIRSSCPPSSP